MKPLYDAFLSYARADDEPFVARLHEHLTQQGLNVWWDRRDMPSRALTFLQEIRDAIDSCTRLIAVVGPHAVRSEYVLAEWQWAGLFSKAVIPILRAGSYELLPQDLARLHTPDFRNDNRYKQALDELVRILSQPVAELAPLYGVPRLPVHFVPPASALAQLSVGILRDIEAPAPISSAQQILVLHGMGGAGKSSAAAALARSTQARRACPDGVFWLTFGPDARASHGVASLARLLDLEATALGDPERSNALLAQALEERRCLIVADDVWSIAAVEGLMNAIGPRCRLLVTTRDASIATSTTPAEQNLNELPESLALKVLASWVSMPSEDLPDIASELAKRCGFLPLALALCGALVRDGQPWQDLLNALTEADLAFLNAPLPNYPYRSAFAALHVSFDVLQRRDPLAARCYRDLAVFPDGQPLPSRAVLTFWRRMGTLSDRHARRVLTLLSRNSLVTFDGSDGDGTLALHSLQHDFLRALVGPHRVKLHLEWVETYSRLCAAQWVFGPNDGHFFQALIWHLLEAGQRRDAAELLLDFAWLECKLRAAGLYSLLTDFDFFPEDSDLRMVRDALRLGSKAIAERPQELAPQVRNRLTGVTQPRVKALLEQPSRTVWLRSLLPTLSQASGPLLLSIPAHQGSIKAVAPLDGGVNILSGGKDGRVVLWDGVTGAPVRIILNGPGIRAMAVSPRCADWAAIVRNGIEIIETAAGRVVAQHDVGDTSNVIDIAISEDGKFVLYSTWSEVHVWNTRDNESYVLHTLHKKPVDARIRAVDVNWSDGTLVTAESAVKGGPGTLRFWDPTTGDSRGSAPCAQQPVKLAITADGSTVASADGVVGSRVLVTDMRSRKLVDLLEHPSNYVNSVLTVAFTDDEQKIAAGTGQGELVLWDRRTSKRMATVRAHESAIEQLASLPGARVVTASNGLLKVWDTTRLGTGVKPFHDHSPTALTVSNDNSKLACGSLDSTVSIWRLKDEVSLLHRFSAHRGGVASLAFSESQAILATGGGDGRRDVEVRLWQLGDYSQIGETELGESRALSAAITSDGTRLVVGDLFDVYVFALPGLNREHRIPLSLLGPSVSVYSLALSADDHAFAGLESGEIVVLDVRQGLLVRRWRAHTNSVRFVGLLPVGIISAAKDGGVKIWQRNGELSHSLRESGDPILGGGVTRDGMLAVTSCDSGVLTLWDLQTMAVLTTFTFDAALWPSTITADGQVVVTGDQNGSVHFLAVERPRTASEG